MGKPNYPCIPIDEALQVDLWRQVLHEGDVERIEVCREALAGVDVVLHQAALGSVPRSVEDPLASNTANVTGTLALLEAARHAGQAISRSY